MKDETEKLDETDDALAQEGHQAKEIEKKIEKEDKVVRPPKFHPDHANDGGVF